ncbi:VOC family protein [Lachnospiraceae bacterium 54-53]
MKASHVIYKVDDLYQAVEEFKGKGFEVEYGTKKKPYNAIIYFSDGPYLELLASSGMPRFMKGIQHILRNEGRTGTNYQGIMRRSHTDPVYRKRNQGSGI